MRSLALALTAVTVLWAAAIVGSPRALASPVAGVGAVVVYAASGRICHQRAERSFTTARLQWPVCARCAGLYLSAAAGVLLGWIGSGWSGWRARRHLALAALPTAATWTLEVTGVMPFSNLSRALAALPLGVVAGWVFIRMLRYDSGLDARQIDSGRTAPLHG